MDADQLRIRGCVSMFSAKAALAAIAVVLAVSVAVVLSNYSKKPRTVLHDRRELELSKLGNESRSDQVSPASMSSRVA